MNDEEEEATCRYCLEPGPGLVSPCKCAGTSQYVHATCLDTWRATNPQYRDVCRECGTPYYWWQSEYAETFMLFVDIPLWWQYLTGILLSALTGVCITIADTDACTARWVDRTWNNNFTGALVEDADLRAVYSITLAGDLLYSLLWVTLMIALAVSLNNPVCYAKTCYKRGVIVGIAAQSHYLLLLVFGKSAGLAVSLSAASLALMPVVFSYYFKYHNAHVLTRGAAPDASFASAPI